MPSKDTKMLEFNQYQKLDQASFIIYADLKCIIENIHGCANKPEKSSRTELGNHKPLAFSISTFENRQNKHDVYRGKNCM